MPERKLVTYKVAAPILGVEVNTLYTLVHQNRVPHIRLGKRLVRFDLAQLKEFIDAHRVEPVA